MSRHIRANYFLLTYTAVHPEYLSSFSQYLCSFPSIYNCKLSFGYRKFTDILSDTESAEYLVLLYFPSGLVDVSKLNKYPVPIYDDPNRPPKKTFYPKDVMPMLSLNFLELFFHDIIVSPNHYVGFTAIELFSLDYNVYCDGCDSKKECKDYKYKQPVGSSKYRNSIYGGFDHECVEGVVHVDGSYKPNEE